MTYDRLDMLQDRMVRHLQNLYLLSISRLMMWNAPDQTARSLYRGRYLPPIPTSSKPGSFEPLQPYPFWNNVPANGTLRGMQGGGKGREGRGENPRGTVHLDLFLLCTKAEPVAPKSPVLNRQLVEVG